MNLTDKTVVITGSGRGLGKELALSYADSGANVVVTARTESEINKTAQLINKKKKGESLAVQADVSKEEDVKNLVNTTINNFKTVDILINNAAVHRAVHILDTDLSTWGKILDINLTGTFLCSKEFGQVMKKQKRGKIINISSTAATNYFPGFGAYTASKSGIKGLSMVLFEELKEFNINVLTLNLGLVNTKHTRKRIESGDPADWIQPEKLANLIKYLSSEEADIITGTTIDIEGRRK
ncbi:MAG: SDR family oxidoreductase [Candidatus Cloacimonetes bacterium]|nr:SDR family oxidoreductase [Candidatus Cloacimonadota bacterium]